MAVQFQAVRDFALSLEDVKEGTSYGTPAFFTRGALILRLREELDSLVVRTSFEEREAMMQADPDTYYITDHYLNYPWVLVRLSHVHPDALRDLLRAAHRYARAEKRRR